MNIEVHGKTEAIIQEQLETGWYASPEAVVEAAIGDWSRSRRGLVLTGEQTNLADVIRAQGTKAIGKGATLLGPGGPPDETADEMFMAIDELRRSTSTRRVLK